MKKLLLIFLLIILAMQCTGCNKIETNTIETSYSPFEEATDNSTSETNSENAVNGESSKKAIKVKRQIAAHRVIAEYYYNESGDITSKTTYTYDSNDNAGMESTTDYQYDNHEFMKVTTTWNNGTIEETTYDYEYNDSGNITTKYENFSDSNGTIINMKTIYDYNSDGRISREWRGTADQAPSDEEYTYYEYDDSGNLIAARHKNPLVNYPDEEYEYDENHLLICKFTRNSSGQIRSVFRYSYNDNNDLIKVTENRYKDNGEESETTQLVEQYEYDYYL